MAHVNSVLVVTGWIALVIVLALICKQRFPAKKELSRKIIHIGTGPVIPLAWWLNLSKEIVIPVSIVITIALLINYHIKLLPVIEEVQRQSYGTIAYGVSITLLFILFWPNKAAAVTAGVLMMAFGDGLAGLIGRQIKSPSWKIWGQTKSIAGTATMAITGLIILTLLSKVIGLPIYPLKIIYVTFLAVGLEQISFWGIDNLTVPIGVAYAWQWIINI